MVHRDWIAFFQRQFSNIQGLVVLRTIMGRGQVGTQTYTILRAPLKEGWLPLLLGTGYYLIPISTKSTSSDFKCFSPVAGCISKSILLLMLQSQVFKAFSRRQPSVSNFQDFFRPVRTMKKTRLWDLHGSWTITEWMQRHKNTEQAITDTMKT